MERMRMIVVGAARPNFMKIAPVIRALEERNVDVTLVHTGQHYDEKMSDAFFRDLGMRSPDVRLGVGSGSHAEMTGAVMAAFEPVLEQVRPYCVVVVGDVNSTLACALVAAKAGVPVAHVEAGLRSDDRSMPEEINRIMVDALSDWLLTPSSDGDANLMMEGVAKDRVYCVGNVMVDSLLANRARADAMSLMRRLDLRPQGYTLLTLHRPSNVDCPETFARLLDAVEVVAYDRPVVFPVHPRTRAKLAEHGLLGRVEAMHNVRLIEPLGYLDCIALMDHAAVVLTDSGGIQEETTVLGVPCLTLRETTERPMTVTHGTNVVVGTNPVDIVQAYDEAPSARSERRPELWDGAAAERIATVLTTVAPPLAASRRTTSAVAQAFPQPVAYESQVDVAVA
jgi:UDP-N-acetylglucosamine 2-epimerase (non-hydrolysing)